MKLLLALLFQIITLTTLAVTITASNGNWNAPGTWDLGRVPQCGDTIVIPLGVTVNIPANVNLNGGGCAPVTILVDGLITFASGRKIRLSAGGCMQLSITGIIQPSGVGGGSSELIEIGGVDWWNASDGNLLGSSLPGGVDLGCGIILPVTLIDYSIEYSESSINIMWSTASERDNDVWLIESSKGGLIWQEIGKVKSLGNTNELRKYDFIDKNPFNGNSYYKLKQIDFNGDTTELFIIASEFMSSKYIIYPMPVSKKMFIDGTIDDFKIITTLSQEVEVEKLIEDGKIIIDFSNIVNGVYFLITKDKIDKIIVKH